MKTMFGFVADAPKVNSANSAAARIACFMDQKAFWMAAATV